MANASGEPQRHQEHDGRARCARRPSRPAAARCRDRADAWPSVRLPEPADQPDADDVDDQGDREQQQARRRTACCRSACPGVLSPVAVWAMKPVMVWPGVVGLSRPSGPGCRPPARRSSSRRPPATAPARSRRRCRRSRRGRPPAAWCASCSRPARSEPCRSDCGTAVMRVLGQRGDGRDDHDAEHQARRRARCRCRPRRCSRSSQEHGCDERQREVAVDDRRNAGEDLQHRLEHLADPGGRRTRTGRSRRRARTGTAISRPISVVQNVPVISGSTPKLGSANVGAHRVPVRNSQTLTSRKNSSAGSSRASDDPDRDQDRQRRRRRRGRHHDALAVAGRLPPDRGRRRSGGAGRRGPVPRTGPRRP